MRAKRALPNAAARNVVGEGRDRAVLEAIVWAGYLTTGQITALHFPTRRRAQRRLRALLDHGLVRAHLQGEALQRETFFTPTPRGLAWLDDRGAFTSGVPRVLRLPRPQKLAHALGIRDIFVAFLRAERAGRFLVDDFHFDGDLTRDPTFSPLRLIPDGVARLQREGAPLDVGVEYDRGTETVATLRAKFQLWREALDASEGGGRTPLHLLVVVCGARRGATAGHLLDELRVGARARVVVAEDVSGLLGGGWPFEVAARVRRPERPASRPEQEGFRPVGVRTPPAFGASARRML